MDLEQIFDSILSALVLGKIYTSNILNIYFLVIEYEKGVSFSFQYYFIDYKKNILFSKRKKRGGGVRWWYHLLKQLVREI